jgi:hypothetical protein
MPPAQASRSEGTNLTAHFFVGTKLPFAPAEGSATALTSETPPGFSGSSRISILRI